MTKMFRIKCKLDISVDVTLTREQINQYFKDKDHAEAPELWSEDDVVSKLGDWDYDAAMAAINDQIANQDYETEDLDGPYCEIVEE